VTLQDSALPWYFHAVLAHDKADVGHVQKVVGEVLFDGIAFVAASNDEVVDYVAGICLDDEPENWFPTYLIMFLGLRWVSSERRVARPPARMTAFTIKPCSNRGTKQQIVGYLPPQL
jgi:hypothetical protein